MTSAVDLFDPFNEAMRIDPYPVYRRYLDAGGVHPGKPAMPEYPSMPTAGKTGIWNWLTMDPGKLEAAIEGACRAARGP